MTSPSEHPSYVPPDSAQDQTGADGSREAPAGDALQEVGEPDSYPDQSEPEEPGTSPLEPLTGRAPLDLLLEALDRAARPPGSVESHTAAYVAWMIADHEGLRTAAALAEAAAALDGGARTYRHIAALGYAAALTSADAPPLRAALDEGLQWLAGREWFAAGRPMSFEEDPVALLGVALGARALGILPAHGSASPHADPAAHRSWLGDLLLRALAVTADPWERGLIQAARHVVDPSPEAAVRIGDAAPDLAAALCGRAQLPIDAVSERAALDAVLALTFQTAGPERAATQRVALRWLFRATPTALPGRASVSDVIAVLKGIERSLRRWRWEAKSSTRNAPVVQWAVNNEYHVQDLLWIVLAPLFPDLEDEENLPSLGQKHPRYDLGIPSLRLLIEAKFVRRGDTREFSDVIEQVAADASLYLRDPARYDRIIAVVWDDSRHVEQHAELVQGLMGITEVVGAVVLTRPGRMGPGLRTAGAPAPTKSEAPAVPARASRASQARAEPRRRT
jgi:hypothetical protein